MRLKRLTLHGFKSFAERTEFDFTEGLTGIIGPNGCGKSNVVDAMKWVLGDQRPSSQRSKEMLDVVFHGAEGRPGMGHAEVTLVLELGTADPYGDGPGPDAVRPDAGRPDAGRPDDLDARVEMTVGRRLFRTGESEYLLNNQVVRLKDIKDALLDTGLGVGGYSVMEQGRIDAVLSANPDDRRAIFDEAAGISRYKVRRKEALRKLDRTELNLARVLDMRQEKASRVRSLKVQATRARSYRETSERLMALRVSLAVLDSIQLRAKLDEVESEFEGLSDAVARFESQREAGRAELAESEAEARALVARLAELRAVAAELRSEERSRREGLESATAQTKSLDETATRCAAEAEAVRETVTRNQQDLEELVRQEDELARCLEGAVADLPGLTRVATETRAAFKNAQRERERVQSRILESMHERTRAKNLVRDEELRIRTVDAGHERLAAQLAEVGRKLSDSRREGARETRIHTDLTERLERLRRTVEAHAQRLGADEADRAAAVVHRHELVARRSALSSQVAVLEELEASRTGFDDAARELIESGDGVVGSLVELLDCPVEIGPALEAVLGARVQALVLEDRARVHGALDALAARDGGGSLVLVDLAAAPSGTSDAAVHRSLAALEASPDGLALASFCRVDPRVRGLIDAMLADVVLVQDLAAAERLRESGQTFVTLRGEVMDGAWFCGGKAEVSAGLLQRRASLESLRDELGHMDGELDEAHAAEASLEGVLARRARQGRRLDGLTDVLVSKQTATWHMLQARERRESELEEELEAGRAELHSRSGERTEGLARMMTPMLDSMLCERREARLADQQRELNDVVREHDRLVTESQDRLAELQSRKAGLDAQLGGLRERRGLLERTLAELDARAATLGQQGKRAREEQTRLVGDVARWRGELADFACRATFTEDLAKTVAASVEDLERGTAAQRSAVTEFEEQLLAAREARAKAELDAREVASRLQRMDEEIQEAYRVDLARVRGDHDGRGLWAAKPFLGPELPPDGEVRERVLAASMHGPLLPPDYYEREDSLPRWFDDPEFVPDDAKREVEVLRARMQRMGSVNLDAEAELKEIQGQYAQLERDCTDLEEARRELMSTLQRINEESRVLFEQTFEAARKNFQEIFRKLFQGGRADIRLVETDDPLDAGIDIFAQPPGKELRSIRLLSGGERSLTALAILFAVFQIKPSPFCILDEVDAALDETNVERFLRVLNEFTDNTQFLVVTHHKRTMADCRVLYGVTMPRKGISTRMSVSLEQVESGAVDDVLDARPTGRTPRIRPAAQEASEA